MVRATEARSMSKSSLNAANHAVALFLSGCRSLAAWTPLASPLGGTALCCTFFERVGHIVECNCGATESAFVALCR